MSVSTAQPRSHRLDPEDYRDVRRHAVPVTVWRPIRKLNPSAEAWPTARGSHHTVYPAATTREIRSDLAELLGVELLFIDAVPTHRNPAHPCHPKEITC